MKALILSGNFGMGHNSVAKAITEELQNVKKDIQVNTIDMLEYIFPIISKVVYKGFNQLVEKQPGLYNKVYKLSEKVEMDMKLSGSIINKKIEILLEMYKPDVIISTLPLCARTMSAYKRIQGLDIPLITCITDVSVHKEWITENTDVYFAPTNEVKENLVKHNIDREKIYVVGIPVKQQFKEMGKEKKSKGERNILIMGGGLGLLPDLDNIMKKLDSVPGLTTTIITGTNQKAFEELTGKYKNAEIVGYTDKVSEYMSKADLMISKAGGITLFESIHSKTPMFVIQPFLAQEKLNAKFVEKNIIGTVIWENEDNYVDIICDLIDDEMKLHEMKENMTRVKEEVIEDRIEDAIEEIYVESLLQ